MSSSDESLLSIDVADDLVVLIGGVSINERYDIAIVANLVHMGGLDLAI